MSADDTLERAVRAARAWSEDAPGDARATRHRVLARAFAVQRTRHWLPAAAALVVVCLVGPTAWAVSTGRLPGLARVLLHRGTTSARPAPRAAHDRVHATTLTASAPAPAPATGVAVIAPTLAPARVTGVAPALALGSHPSSPPVVPAGSTPGTLGHVVASSSRGAHVPAPTDRAPALDDLALYATAHQAHFVARDPAAAVIDWDAYLRAAPTGPFAPEARYNRALDLIRLGRLPEALDALQPFARGEEGGYRQREAIALVERYGHHGAGPEHP